MADVLTWIRNNQIGDLAGIAGIFISIIGFCATLYGVAKSKSAAESAEEAAKKTRESVRSLDAILDFSATISALEEINASNDRARGLSTSEKRRANF